MKGVEIENWKGAADAMRIGILSFQGNIEEHDAIIAEAARALGERVETVKVKRKESADSLIIPGARAL